MIERTIDVDIRIYLLLIGLLALIVLVRVLLIGIGKAQGAECRRGNAPRVISFCFVSFELVMLLPLQNHNLFKDVPD